MNSPSFRVVIPARYASSRLPGKVLEDIAGKTLLQHVYERAVASGAETVVIATDDQRVKDVAEGFGAQVLLTAQEHPSGSDRVAEVATQLNWGDDVPVVNVQGDAPLLPAESIAQVAALLTNSPSADMATLCVRIDNEAEMHNPNVVKVVFDDHGKAMYFSRSVIPSNARDSTDHAALNYCWRHIGLYAYKVSALQTLTNAPPAKLELIEHLEQLRALALGMTLLVAEAEHEHGPDVDTPEDLAAVRAIVGVGGS